LPDIINLCCFLRSTDKFDFFTHVKWSCYFCHWNFRWCVLSRVRTTYQARTSTPVTLQYREGDWFSCAVQVHTTHLVRGAHTTGSDTSSITFSHDNSAICTRGGDDTVKLWDLRKFKHPIATACDLDNFFPM